MIPRESLEAKHRSQGFGLIAGLDEVGRSSWAGPLVMGAVILPNNLRLNGLRDSKLLTRSERDRLARRIKKNALSWSIGIVAVSELNSFGLAEGLQLAAKRAIGNLKLVPDLVLVDGLYEFKKLDTRQKAYVRADMTIRCVAAASVVAKVERDRMMRTLHRTHQNLRRFRFDLNKGYPSPLHRQELRSLGPTGFHRTCFKPVARELTRPLF
ncbi:ribonuclease HII [Candidatus Berkelbacteria bacterium]|nr:ribonuclease HII [Candidatus Berkelbacteria bacterium]